ncbi:MAG TPA: Wzz/FepE/Etk N-terminal domain-containing protein [Planctomycetota bacterium]|nr:Wzz/FepE/Etk N-terminal domain-containing protein [Planctomycetota bacterium]
MAERTDQLLQQGDAREALDEILRAIRRNRVRVVFTTLVVLLLGVALSMLWPNKYESSTKFALRDWYVVADSVLLEELGDLPLQKKLKSLENELRSRKRVEAVMNELQWPEWQDTAGKESERRKLMEKLGDNLVVEMNAGVTGDYDIEVIFRWTSPIKARDFVNRLRDNWIQLTLESYKKRLEEQRDRMEGVVRERETDYSNALAAEKAYQLEQNVPALGSEEVNNEQRATYELDLAKNSAELETVVGELQRLQGELAAIPQQVPQVRAPETDQQAELLVKLQAAEAQLKAVCDPVTGYTPLHPLRKQRQSSYDSLLAQLKEAGYDPEGGIVKDATNPLWLAKQNEITAKHTREMELRSLVSSTKQTLDDIQHRQDMLPVVRSELARLSADAELKSQLLGEAKTAVQPLREKVAQYRAQSFGVDAQGFGTVQSGPFELLEPGVEPDNPVLPITVIILAVSIVVGVLVGTLGPVLAEMTRSSFGTVKEVSRSLGVPVLGAVDIILTARDVRARRVQQGLTYVTMTLVLLSLAAAIWIYQFNPQVLPSALLRTLREVRMALT